MKLEIKFICLRGGHGLNFLLAKWIKSIKILNKKLKSNKIINNTSIKLVITKNNICIVKLVIEYGRITNTT